MVGLGLCHTKLQTPKNGTKERDFFFQPLILQRVAPDCPYVQFILYGKIVMGLEETH